MIDVHILTMPNDNQAWFEKCLNSLKKEPVSVQVCNGIKGDIGNARADAFLLGDNEYVSFVDPDDYILPGGFLACLDELHKSNCDVVYTQEIITGFSGVVHDKPLIRDWIHHLIVMRRDVVLKHIEELRKWKWNGTTYEGRVFIEKLQSIGHKVSNIKKPYYVWRRHIDSFTMKAKLHGMG